MKRPSSPGLPSFDFVPKAKHPRTRRWTRIGLTLVAGTAAYNVVEAGVALWQGVIADSAVLVGFGLDSVIELVAATALGWRLTHEWRGADAETLEAAEGTVMRIVGATFLALAAYVTLEAAWTLWAQEAPKHSGIGIVLAIASLVLMPFLAWGKLRAAAEVDSPALRAEANETLACSYLSFVLLVGLVANAAYGWWWADPLAALAMVPWLVREGKEGLFGEDEEEHGHGHGHDHHHGHEHHHEH